MSHELATAAIIYAPLLSAVLCLLLQRHRTWLVVVVSAQVTTYIASIGAMMWDPTVAISATSWLPALGSTVELSIDGPRLHSLALMVGVFLVAVLAETGWSNTSDAVVHAAGHGAHTAGSGARLSLLSICLSALTLFVLTDDLLIAAAAHGTAAFFLAALVGHGGGVQAAAAARRFLQSALAGTLLLAAAAALLAASAGSTSLLGEARPDPETAQWIGWLLALAIALQLPLIPLHTWLTPLAVAGSLPGRVLVFGVWCSLGGLVLLRFGLGLSADLLAFVQPVPLVWGVLCCCWAACLALAQPAADLARRVGSTALAASGLLVVAVSGLDPAVVSGGWLLTVAVALPRVVLLLLACWLLQSQARRPALAAAWVVLAASVVCLPVGGGFAGWFLIADGLSGSLSLVVLLAATAVLAWALIAPAIDLSGPTGGSVLPANLRYAAVLALTSSVLLGLWPSDFLAAVHEPVERDLSGLGTYVDETVP